MNGESSSFGEYRRVVQTEDGVLEIGYITCLDRQGEGIGVQPQVLGRANFRGELVHPKHWRGQRLHGSGYTRWVGQVNVPGG